jgi:hypothetical protein
MRSLSKKIYSVLFSLLISLVGIGWIASVAIANTPSHPAYIWFSFDRAPTAVQFIGCRNLLCEQQTLLMQSGACQGSGCLNTAPLLKAPHRFECAENVCLYEESPLADPPIQPAFQLIAQFPNGVRTSASFTPNFRSAIAGYGDRHINVISQGDSLRLDPDEHMKPSRWQTFANALVLTQVSELLFAGIVLTWRRINRSIATQILLTIGFINLLTFPIVWFFFPSLQSFQYSTTRTFGIFSIIVASVFSLGLAFQKNVTTQSIIRLASIWLLLSPLMFVAAFLAAFFIGYEELLPSASGLPSTVVLPASVVCTIVWKGWFIRRVSQNRLSRWQSFLLSTLMNTLSLGLGLLFIPAAKQFG